MARWCIPIAAALALVFQLARAADPLPATQSVALRFAEIRRQLASDNFALRESGQKQLDLIPPSQVATLRTLATRETDPEVKARLDTRIDAMDVYLLIHPKPLSLDIDKVTLDKIASQLNDQIGSVTSTVTLGRGRAPNANAFPYTLRATDQPFWQILADLQRQSPIQVTGTLSISAAGNVNSLQLSNAANPRPFTVFDTFAIVTPQISGPPATGSWSIRVQGFSDPRVRIVRYSPLRIDKLTDQNGTSLLPLVLSNANTLATAARPTTYWTSAASLSIAPGAKRITEFRANIALSILESEQTYSLNLNQPLAPIATSRGTLTVDQNAAGDFAIHLTDPALPDTVVRSTPTMIRVFDKTGKALTNYSSTTSQINLTLPANVAPADVEISWPDKTHDMLLPIDFHDIDLPAPAPPADPAIRP